MAVVWWEGYRGWKVAAYEESLRSIAYAYASGLVVGRIGVDYQ